MTTLQSVRQDLADAIEQAGYAAHEAPLATIIPPAVVIVPDAPYLEADTISSGGIRWLVNYELIAAVQYVDPRSSLAQLEDIVVKVAVNLPKGTVLGDVQQPTVEEVGPSSLLTARIAVSVRANLTAP
jgi:hypothetical protein